MRRLLVVIAVVALAGCSSDGGDRSGDTTAPTFPSVTGTVATVPAGSAVPQGYSAITVTIRDADGTTREACVLVADTEPQRERGLMDVDGLGGYDGMLFRFPEPTQASFYMFHTRIPLSVAFFDTDGRYVSSTDMAPCGATAAKDCPLYPAQGPFLDALEVTQGGLAPLGIGAASQITVGRESCSRSP